MMTGDFCALCGEPIHLDLEVGCALDDTVSFVCEPCGEKVRAAVEYSVKAQVTEFRRIERIRAAALLN